MFATGKLFLHSQNNVILCNVAFKYVKLFKIVLKMFLFILPQCRKVIAHCAQWKTMPYAKCDVTVLSSSTLISHTVTVMWTSIRAWHHLWPTTASKLCSAIRRQFHMDESCRFEIRGKLHGAKMRKCASHKLTTVRHKQCKFASFSLSPGFLWPGGAGTSPSGASPSAAPVTPSLPATCTTTQPATSMSK